MAFMRYPGRSALAAAVALAAPAGGLQAPHAAWRTIATAHYRIHYPPVLAEWAQDVAARIEGIHQQVVALVGYESPDPVQVLLVDPMADANGMAVALLDNPYLVLWRTAPRSDDLHGNALNSWTEELLSHEATHIHHLLRPRRPRTVLTSLFALPVGPVALKCPRWVTEGYATLAEGRITGSGRPHSALRAALIRQWARTGKLPPYEALSASQGYLGASMAYQVGSTYLEWLERQRPAQPDIFQRLWKQVASGRHRTFEAAFLATFGFPPRDGYQRFQAEAGHDALDWELRLRAAGLREGEPVLRSGGTLRDLAVSPDGGRLLAALDSPGHSGLRIWDLAAARPKPPARLDPFNGVADVPPEWPARPASLQLPALDHRLPQQPEWVDDRTVRFRIRRADAEGTLHLQPALWHLGAGVEQQPATLPAAPGRTLEPVHRDGAWCLELDGQRVPLPGQAIGRAVLDPARGLLWAACEVEGTCNIVRVPFTRADDGLSFQPAQVMTRTASAAWNPAPSPDGRTLYFTTLDPRGMEIRRLDATLPPVAAPGPATAEPERSFTREAVLPAPVRPADLPRVAGPLASVPYDAAHAQWLQISSGASLGPAGESWQLGVAGRDLLGRLSWQVLAGFGDAAGPRGAMAGLSSTAWPWMPSLTLFSALERPSRQRFAPAAGDRQRRGGELAFTWRNLGETPFWFSPVAAIERLEPLPGPARTRSLLGVRAGLQALWARGPWGVAVGPALQIYAGNTRGAGSERWDLLRGGLALRLENPAAPVTLRASGGRLTGSGPGFEAFRLGGAGTSLVPESLDCDRIEQPALPALLATGDRFQRWRCEVGGAVSAYLEGTSLWYKDQPRPPWLRVAGLQATLDNPLATPGALGRLRLQLGVHRPLDGIMRNRTVATLTLVVRP